MRYAPTMTVKLDDLLNLALAAGREIMAVRATGFEAQKKLDGSPVTLADHRAEAVIEAGLHALAPGIPMLGEEAVSAGRIPDLDDRFFCVDPLDGTRGFAKGGGQFTVNIGLIDRGAPVMGAIYAPASGELYGGEPGRAVAARCDTLTASPVTPIESIAAKRAAPSRWRVVASDASGRNMQTARFIAALDAEVSHSSSSMKFCRLAEGSADLYPRFGNVNEWDAAAGHAILRAAGGDIMRLDGAPLTYGHAADSFLVRGFIAYAGEAARRAALEALKSF